LPAHKILIADDDPSTLEFYMEIIRREGYDVTGASNGLEAIKAAQQKRFDLFLTDIVMPGLDGLAAAQSILEIQPNIVCIAVTGFGTVHKAIEAFRLGFLEFLVKPFNLEDFKNAVNRALSLANGKEDGEPPLNQVRKMRLQQANLLRQLSEYEKQFTAPPGDQFPLTKLSRLTDGIVHDMRSGLGVIRNTIGFLEDNLAATDHQSDLLKITRSLDFCELVLRNLSALGGQDIFQPKSVNLEKVMREVYFMLERKLVDVDLVVDVDPGVPEILADEGQMRQVFMNLIKNAGEAMPDGGTLTVRTRREGPKLRVEVADTGCGISPENQARLFHEFFTTKDRGYGLGLHIVDTIVKRHGGTIEVESKVGEGTTFTLRLPIEAE
jgi:signal transduction histidine kinase